MAQQKFTTLAFYSLALVLLLGLGLGLHQYYIYKVTRETHKTTVDLNLSLMHMRADGYLERLALDAEFIANSPILRMYLENPSAETLARAGRSPNSCFAASRSGSTALHRSAGHGADSGESPRWASSIGHRATKQI